MGGVQELQTRASQELVDQFSDLPAELVMTVVAECFAATPVTGDKRSPPSSPSIWPPCACRRIESGRPRFDRAWPLPRPSHARDQTGTTRSHSEACTGPRATHTDRIKSVTVTAADPELAITAAIAALTDEDSSVDAITDVEPISARRVDVVARVRRPVELPIELEP